MTVFLLPTAGKADYRGKYPTRARSVGATGSGGRHVELNNGARLWSIDDRTPEFNAASRYDDYAAILARAVPMTTEQYAELMRAAELDRSILGIAGNTRRESIREQARQIRLAIKAPATVEPEAPAAPVRTIDCTPTWSAILPALIAAYADGTATGRGIAREELTRMAKAADSAIAYQRQRDDESARAVKAEALAASRLKEATAARIKIMELESLAQRSADCTDSHFVTVRGLRAAFPHINRESN